LRCAGNILNIAPPLVIARVAAGAVVGILDEALGEGERGFGLA
jgi:hypothetical protein